MHAFLILLAAQTTAARSADVKSVDSICQAIYQTLSGPANQKRDWGRLRSLFTPDARMIAVVGENKKVAKTITVEDYIRQSGAAIEQYGFRERELAHRTEQFGNMAHVFSTYESRYTSEEQEHTQRGINSIQLFNDGSRWWVVTIYWQDESDEAKLPAKYLKGGNWTPAQSKAIS